MLSMIRINEPSEAPTMMPIWLALRLSSSSIFPHVLSVYPVVSKFLPLDIVAPSVVVSESLRDGRRREAPIRSVEGGKGAATLSAIDELPFYLPIRCDQQGCRLNFYSYPKSWTIDINSILPCPNRPEPIRDARIYDCHWLYI